jgi:hypothetical protein
MEDEKSRSMQRTPFLKNSPMLGSLLQITTFRHPTRRERSAEL